MAKKAESLPERKISRLSERERRRLLSDILAEADEPNDVWIFGFGSLMWRPGFQPREKKTAILRGFERKFHIWSTSGRGTQERPGLGLCLEPVKEGICIGIAYRILPDTKNKDLGYLWDREMTSGVYLPKWVAVECDEGSHLSALTWVVNKNHVRYAGPRSVREMAKIIAGSKGKYGTCREYLANTIQEMAKLGQYDPTLEKVLAVIENEMGIC